MLNDKSPKINIKIWIFCFIKYLCIFKKASQEKTKKKELEEKNKNNKIPV